VSAIFTALLSHSIVAAMPKANLRVFPSLEALSRQAAGRFAELARQRAAKGEAFAAALSGGSTPKRLYELLARPEFSGALPWGRIHLFQVDERCVPPDHTESNYRMIRQALLSQAPVPAEHFHRMEAERQDLEDAARRYAAEIARILAPAPGEWPRFDLILLGLGPDGHTASLFPESPALAEQRLWVRPNYVEKFKAHRLTLTFPVINAASEVIFLVAGEDKAEALGRVLQPQSEGRSLPAQGVCPQNGRLTWFVDEAAARLLASA